MSGVESPDRRVPNAAGAVVLASIVVVDPAGWYPFVVAKFAAVSIAVLVAWWAAMGDGSRSLPRAATASFAALIGVLTVAAVAGREPLYGWTGTPERHLGVTTWLLFFAAFVTGGRLAGGERLRRFSRWVVAGGLVLGTYALLERFDPPIATDAVTHRLGGTYGSASFLGAALCLVIPITIAAAASDPDRRWRTAAGAAALLGVVALAGSGTRAAWAGLGVAGTGALASVVDRRPLRVRPRRWWLLVAPAAAITAALTTGTFERGAGAWSRLDEWRVGWRILAAHPWLGVGPEGYRTALADGVTEGYERTYGRDVIPDRAHNVLLDVGAAGGVLAMVLYAAIASAVVAAAWAAMRRRTDRSDRPGVLRAGLAAATVAYLVQQLMLFPVATLDPVFWLVAGALVGRAATGDIRVARRARTAARLIAVPAVVVLAIAGVTAVAADRAARDAVEQQRLASAERAVSLRPDVVRYHLLVARLAPSTIAGLSDAVAGAERSLDRSPHDPIALLTHAELLSRLAVATRDAGDVAAALHAWEGLADDDPNCYRCQLGLGYAAALDGDTERAIAAFADASRLEPAHLDEAATAVEDLLAASAPGHASESAASSDTSGTDRDG